jgi:cytoskeletal protein CcmA (bactofilin family)
VEENLYISGGTVEISGVVDGDLIAGGNTVTITGTVTGDLYAAGSKVDISGNVYGSTFLTGQTVDVSGSIARNSYITSMFANISGNIGKDATIFASNSSITGKVTEDVRVFAGRSVISGSVKGEVLVYSGTSTVDEELVEGEIYENMEIEGKKMKNLENDIQPRRIGAWAGKAFFGINVFSILIGFVSMYIVGVVLIYLAPVKTLKIEEKVTDSLQEFLFSFLIGLGIFVIIPMPLIILSFTLIGTPLAILIIAVLLFASIFGTVWVESAIGQKILSTTDKKDPKRLLSLLIGRGLTTVVNFIPIVRGIYKWVLSMTAVGAIVRMKYDAYKEVKKGRKK